MLDSLHLEHFRSHADLQVSCNPGVTVLLGQNAAGKTSVIEALHLLATGKSFRASKVNEMIAFDQEYARVTAVIHIGNESDSMLDALSAKSEASGEMSNASRGDAPNALVEQSELAVLLTRGVLQGKKTAHTHFFVNDIRRRASSVSALLQTTVFRPEDMRLIEGSPTRRRAFLDEVISSFNPEYARSLSVYEQSLRRYNKLLWLVREGEQPKTVLEYWELSLQKHGEVLTQARTQFFASTKHTPFGVQFLAEYQPSGVSRERLSTYQPRAIAAGHSLIGPHRDDFSVLCDVERLSRGNALEFHDVAAYGSRGQQRLAVLWLKTCQLFFVEQQTNQKPLLLLDDIFSELDEDNRQVVLKLLLNHQAIVTSAAEDVLAILPKQTLLVELSGVDG